MDSIDDLMPVLDKMTLNKSDDEDLSDTGESDTGNVFSDGSTTSDLLPPTDEFMARDLVGYPRQNLRTLYTIETCHTDFRLPTISLERLRRIERGVKEVLKKDPDMVLRWTISNEGGEQGTSTTEDKRVLKKAGGLFFWFGEFRKCKKGVSDCGPLELELERLVKARENERKWAFDIYLDASSLRLDRIITKGTASVTCQFAQASFFSRGFCCPMALDPYKHTDPTLQRVEKVLNYLYGDDELTYNPFYIEMTDLQDEFTNILAMRVYEWVTVVSSEVSMHVEILQPESRMKHWVKILTPQVLRRMFSFLAPGLDLDFAFDTSARFSIYKTWSAWMVAIMAEEIVVSWYGAPDYGRKRLEEWDVEQKFFNRMLRIRPKLKLQDIRMGGMLAIAALEDQEFQ